MKLGRMMMVVLFAVAFLAACSQESPKTGQAEKRPEQSAPAVAQKDEIGKPAVESEEIIGTVMTTDKGLALNTDTGLISITGADLSAMVGKKVKVTGAISESQEGKVIQVMTATPME